LSHKKAEILGHLEAAAAAAAIMVFVVDTFGVVWCCVTFLEM
jgi:hypothetical protein